MHIMAMVTFCTFTCQIRNKHLHVSLHICVLALALVI